MIQYGKTLIVNLFGGPGSGKSTTRAALFSKMKLLGISCEEANEWCKAKVYERNPYVFTDQLYIFAKQRKLILQMLNDVNVIVTDSPLLLSAIYEEPVDPIHYKLYIDEYLRFNNLNIFLNRVKPYSKIGRFQDESEAVAFDWKIKAMLDSYNLMYYTIDGDDQAPNAILDIVTARLG